MMYYDRLKYLLKQFKVRYMLKISLSLSALAPLDELHTLLRSSQIYPPQNRYTMASGIGRTSCVIHRHIRPAARQTTSRVRPRSIAAFQQIPPCIANTHQRSRFYGTKTEVNPLNEIVAPPLLRPYLRNCLTEKGPGTPQSNLEFTLSFLGTASGSSTMHRNGSCTALRLGGQTYLFDCAEGTIRQIIHSRISVGSITKIFISHLHGDHVYGLIPIILEVQVAMKLMKSAADANPKKSRRYKNRTVEDERPTLEIYGPPGLYNYVSMNMALVSLLLSPFHFYYAKLKSEQSIVL